MPSRQQKRHTYEIIALALAVFLTFSSVIGTVDLSLDADSSPAKDAFAESTVAEPLYKSAGLSLSASRAALITADGKLLYGKDHNERAGMASTTKIMTGLLAAEYLETVGKDASCTVSENAVGVEGSSIYLEAGETVKLIDLLYATLLASANDAATALAEAIGGSVEAFVAQMNNRAEALGLTATHFENPHGLFSDSHYTTAYELALLTAEALKNPCFATVVATRQYHFATDRSARSFSNHNRLLASYEGACGVKTGFTKATGRCLVSAAERDGVKLIAVTLNAPDDWNDHRALLDFGFAHTVCLTLAEVGDFRYTLPVLGGTALTVANTESLAVILPADHGEISYRVELPRFVFSPKEGGALGKVIFYESGNAVGALFLTPIA